MDDVPRRRAPEPPSPPLQPRDLRSTAGPSGGPDDPRAPDGLVRARRVSVWPDGSDSGDERGPDSPGSGSGSRRGFYSFVDDPASPEAELNEAWMVSPQRRVHLATLKEDKAFKVQTYASGKKPESLFADSESRYRVREEHRPRPFDAEEEKRLRKEIIQKQAPKKNSPLELSQQLSVPEKMDRTPSTDKPLRGFGPSYGPLNAVPPRSVEPGTIDRTQIDFSVARRRFLELERGEPNVLVDPRRRPGEDAAQSEGATAPSSAGSERTSGPSGVFNALDPSGVKATFPDGALPTARKGEADVHRETPIEREIRLVQEREENLRRSRGLRPSDSFWEMVEIQTKRVRSPLIPREAGEKGHVSVIIQRERNVDQRGPERPMDPQDTKERFREDRRGPGRPMDPQDTKERFREGRRSPGRPKGPQDTKELFREDRRDLEVLLPPCRPHGHPEETSTPPSPTWTRTVSWRANRESSGLNSVPDFIEKEIEEALRRERELQESRQSRESLESGQSQVSKGYRQSSDAGGSRGEIRESRPLSAPPLAEQASKRTVAQFQPAEKSVSPPSEGLTGAPARDPEQRRDETKTDESSYAGIQPIDDINNQVVESTRVIRHQNQRALRWEAGVFADRPHQ